MSNFGRISSKERAKKNYGSGVERLLPYLSQAAKEALGADPKDPKWKRVISKDTRREIMERAKVVEVTVDRFLSGTKFPRQLDAMIDAVAAVADTEPLALYRRATDLWALEEAEALGAGRNPKRKRPPES